MAGQRAAIAAGEHLPDQLGARFERKIQLDRLPGGRYLDGKLGTDPWLTLAGAMVGVVLGMIFLVRRVTRATGTNED